MLVMFVHFQNISTSLSASSISFVRLFKLIHCDIWILYKIPSLSGAKYFLTIMDDYSQFT